LSHFLIVAYTHYMYDGRVRRNAEALAERGDTVDVVCLASTDPYSKERVNVIGLEIPRYRGSSRTSYARSYLSFFSRAASLALRLGRKRRYDVIIVCTMPDAAVLCALPCRLLGSKILLDVHDTMPELYLDKFGGSRGKFGARLLMIEERLCAALADRILAVHEPHADRLMSAGVSRTKISVVTNCRGTLLDSLSRDAYPSPRPRCCGRGDTPDAGSVSRRKA
jgi:glycosyltransferase involved in cell wall biosynthesis